MPNLETGNKHKKAKQQAISVLNNIGKNDSFLVITVGKRIEQIATIVSIGHRNDFKAVLADLLLRQPSFELLIRDVLEYVDDVKRVGIKG